MPTNSESLNRELFRLLSKYKPKPLDAGGKVTPVPEEADVFKFEFTKDGEDYGTVYVTIDEDRVLTVYYGDDVSDSPDDITPGLGYDDTWWGLHDQLSAWRMTKGLKGFDTKNKDRVGDDMARRNHMRNKDKIAEGYYPMGKSRSYSDAVPSVKIVIEHSRVIEEGEQRYRNINRIFLENQDGERYLLDTKKPGIARVYARHIAEGGKVNDDRWSHIGNLCEEYQKMAGFVRATRNGQFNESAQALVNEGLEHYQSLRESLSRMTGKRGYNAYFENWTPSLMEDGTEENNLNELFVQETLDPRIESVMPILNRIHKKVSESIVDKEMNKLAEWADSLVEDESIKSNNPVGIPEGLDQYSPVTQAITRRILSQHPDLLQKHGPEKVANAIDDVAEFVGDVEEIGSSDVSGWVKQVAQSLDGHEGVEESALQAYLGDKKYGEKGMDALRKAGREHAGKEKMQSIRAKFSDKEEDVSEEVDLGQYDAVKSTHKGGTTPEQEREFRKKVQAYGKELEQRQKEKAEKTDEDLDANQKRVGQLGPTEKVKNNNIGKLVGANENFINSTSQAVTTEDEMDEGAHTQHAMRGRNPGADEFEHDFENDKIDNIHDKISKMLKRLEKPKHEPNMKDTDLGSTVLESHQLNEGLMDSLNGMIAKIKAMPGIQKYIQLAQSKKQALVQALQHSANGKDLVANIQRAVGGQQAVAEGWGEKIGGAVMASAGGGLIAAAADIMMRAYVAMGKPDLTQMMNDPNGKNALVLVSMLVVLGALAMFAGGHQVKQGLEQNVQPMREGQEDLDAILRIIRK